MNIRRHLRRWKRFQNHNNNNFPKVINHLNYPHKRENPLQKLSAGDISFFFVVKSQNDDNCEASFWLFAQSSITGCVFINILVTHF